MEDSAVTEPHKARAGRGGSGADPAERLGLSAAPRRPWPGGSWDLKGVTASWCLPGQGLSVAPGDAGLEVLS